MLDQIFAKGSKNVKRCAKHNEEILVFSLFHFDIFMQFIGYLGSFDIMRQILWPSQNVTKKFLNKVGSFKLLILYFINLMEKTFFQAKGNFFRQIAKLKKLNQNILPTLMRFPYRV